jgi:hypothetical protein
MGIALEGSKRASRPCRVVSECSEAVMGFGYLSIGALGHWGRLQVVLVPARCVLLQPWAMASSGALYSDEHDGCWSELSEAKSKQDTNGQQSVCGRGHDCVYACSCIQGEGEGESDRVRVGRGSVEGRLSTGCRRHGARMHAPSTRPGTQRPRRQQRQATTLAGVMRAGVVACRRAGVQMQQRK